MRRFVMLVIVAMVALMLLVGCDNSGRSSVESINQRLDDQYEKTIMIGNGVVAWRVIYSIKKKYDRDLAESDDKLLMEIQKNYVAIVFEDLKHPSRERLVIQVSRKGDQTVSPLLAEKYDIAEPDGDFRVLFSGLSCKEDEDVVAMVFTRFLDLWSSPAFQ